MGDMAMGECKDDKKTFTLFKQTLKITKEDMEDYHWAMFTHAMDFFQKWASLKKPIPEERKKKKNLLKDALMEDLVTLWNLLLTKYMEHSRRHYATPSM